MAKRENNIIPAQDEGRTVMAEAGNVGKLVLWLVCGFAMNFILHGRGFPCMLDSIAKGNA